MRLLLSYNSKIESRLPMFKELLSNFGHTVYDFDFSTNYDLEKTNEEEMTTFQKKQIQQRIDSITEVDGVLVLNFRIHDTDNEIGPSEIIDIYEAFQQNKPIFIYNKISDKKLERELKRFKPIFINSDVKKIIDPYISIYPILSYLKENGEQLLDVIHIKLGMEKENCDILLNQAQRNGWIYIDHDEYLSSVELTSNGLKKIEPECGKKYKMSRW